VQAAYDPKDFSAVCLRSWIRFPWIFFHVCRWVPSSSLYRAFKL